MTGLMELLHPPARALSVSCVRDNSCTHCCYTAILLEQFVNQSKLDLSSPFAQVGRGRCPRLGSWRCKPSGGRGPRSTLQGVRSSFWLLAASLPRDFHAPTHSTRVCHVTH